MEDFRILVFGHIIQAAIQGYVGLAFYGKRLKGKESALIGLLIGLVVWVARGVQNILGISFGFHIIVIFLAYIVAMKYIAKINWGFAITGAIMGYILIFFSESLVLVPAMNALGWNLEVIKPHPWWWVLVESISTLPLLIIAVFLNFSKFRLIDLTADQASEHI